MRNRFLKVLLLVVLLASVLMPTFISQPQIAQATGGLQQPILGGFNDALNFATITAEYNSLMGGRAWVAGENQCWNVIPTNGSISSLYVRLSADPTNANSSYTFTIMKNSIATSLTCTIAAGSTTGSDVNPTHAISLVAGDTVSIRSVATDTDPATATASWSTLWESTAVGESIAMGIYSVSTTAATYISMGGYLYAATEAVAQSPMPTSGNFSKMYVVMSADAGTAPDDYIIFFRNGGVNGSNTVTIVADNKTGNITNVTDAVVAGNLVNFAVFPENTPSVAPFVSIGIVFVSNISGESCIFGGSSDLVTNSQTEYMFLGSNSYDLWITTEATMYSVMQPCTIRNLYVQLSAAAGAGNDYTISINKNAGASSGLTVNIAGAVATSGNDITHTYDASAGDTAGLKQVPNSSPTSVRIKASVVAYIAPAASNVYLTTSSGSGGNCTTPAEGTWAYNVSEVVNISATADPCYHFVNWTGNTSNISDVNAISTSINMGTDNKSATANFAINTSTITYNANANGTIVGSTPQTINCGTNTTYVLASPNACYKFVNWNDSSTMNPRSDVGTSTNQSFTANFAINTSVITYSAGAGGTIVGSTPQTINCSSYTTAVTATANACYSFVDWSDANVSATRTDLGTSTNQTFTANFAVNTSTITYNANANGTIVGSTPQTIDCGNYTTAVTATPNWCYHFTTWSDANTSATRTDIGTSTNQTFTASFAIDVKTVAYAAGVGGSVNGSWPENVNCGSNGSWVLATADPCYTFTNWSDASTTNPRQATNVSANVSLTANFTPDVFVLTYNAGANGAIVGATPQNVDCHDDGTAVTANPNACYHFTSWSDGILTASRTDLNITANKTVTASFAIDTFTLNVSSGANGNVTTPTEGTHTYNCGQVVNLVATPDWAYNFSTWSGDTATILDVNDETTTITMNGNYSINCSFVGSLSLFPPTNLIPTLTENASGNTSFWCLNLSWTKGVNSPYTIIVICRDEVLPCANKSTTNLSTACMVLYNGNGSSFDIETCGWQIDYYDYTITAWGSDGAGNYSVLCTNLTLGGTKMMDLFGIAIGVSVALIIFVLAMWKKQWWIFMTDGLIWFILMAFTFTQYTTDDMMYWFGYVYLILAIICIGCIFWFREKHEPIIEEPEETQDDKREKRAKKLSSLRNLTHKISGKDY